MAQINDSSQQQIEQIRREGQERSEVCVDLLSEGRLFKQRISLCSTEPRPKQFSIKLNLLFQHIIL